MNSLPKPNLKRCYTLDKLIGPFSKQFLSRVPAAVKDSQEASDCLSNQNQPIKNEYERTN
jgi:hypothetical protein